MSQTKIIAVVNQKGGVGKTTTAAALLSMLSNRGARVLGVDLDPQGSLGYSLGLDIEQCTTLYDVFRGEVDVNDAIAVTDTCDMLASNILLSAAEQEFVKPGREFMLREAISSIKKTYDFIIMDTPPALNILTVNAYVATQSLIIPMAPEILSLLGVTQIKETIESIRTYYNPQLKILGILLNRFDKRVILNNDVLAIVEEMSKDLGTKVFESKIRSSVVVAEAPAHKKSVTSHKPYSNPALDFEKLCDEIVGTSFPYRHYKK